MHPDRDETIRAKFNDLAKESFPDAPDVVWQVRRIVHADNYSFVEAEPNPATVDYPKYMFVLSFAPVAAPAVVGCYSLDQGLWRLSFSAPNTPSDWVGLFPAGTADWGSQLPAGTADGFEAGLLPLLQQGKKIAAIKAYREKTGAGLREAKDAVEALAQKHGLTMSKAGCAGLIILLPAVFVSLISLFASAASPQAADNQLLAKKLIEWGWDEPDTRFIRQNIAQMEQFPFDGLVLHTNSSKGGGLTWEMWGNRPFTLEEFKQAMDDLKNTNFKRFTDRFLRVNVTPGKVDWFDDRDWAAVLNNVGVAAQIAKQGRCKGFMFDVEQYEGKLFDYRQLKHKDSKTFAAYQAKVRQRGKEWIQAVNKEYPDITILLTFGYVITQPRGQAKDRSQVPYGLLADFLDGMLDGCSKETTIVDAWERSYSYKQRNQFEQAYQTIKKKALDWTGVAEKYRNQVKAGFGVWLDNDWRRKGWNLTDFSKNHFSPAEFESTVRSALQVSDQYVWIYTEQPKWWTREKLPQAYIDALANARKPASGAARPLIRKLGTMDLLMVETTPVVFKNRLYRFEYVRDNYPANKTGASYFRIVDVATGKPTPAFAKGQHLGSALVEGDTVYAFGTDKWGGSKITVFRSKDMEKWEERLALHLPGWELFNTSVCKADGRYVMAVEVGGPKEVVGVPFTIFLAESKDLLTWKLLPQECLYSKEK